MFSEYFGFKQSPFNLTDEPTFFYTAPERQRICEQILDDIQNSFSPIILTGQPGVGKTLFLKELAHRLQSNFHCIIPIEGQLNYAARVSASLEQLSSDSVQSKKIVLLVDDAHKIPNAELKLLLLLTKHQADKEQCRSFQMIWCGSPSLNHKLTDLNDKKYQNYPFFYHLIGFNKTEVSRYINFSLEQVGYTEPDKLLNPKAIDKITELSHGSPRSINQLCNKALELAYEHHIECVTEELVIQAANLCSLPLETPPPAVANLKQPVVASNTETALPKKITIRIQINKTDAADFRSVKKQQKPTRKIGKKFWLYAGSLVIGFCVTSLASYQYLSKSIAFFAHNSEPKLAAQAPLTSNIVQAKKSPAPEQQIKPIINTQNVTHLSEQRTPTKPVTSKNAAPSATTPVAHKTPSSPPLKTVAIKPQKANVAAPSKAIHKELTKTQQPQTQPVSYKTQQPKPLLKQQTEKKEGVKNTIVVKTHSKSTAPSEKQLTTAKYSPATNKPISHNTNNRKSDSTKTERIDAEEAAARERAANRLNLDRLGIEFSPDSLVNAAEKGDLLATRLLIKGGIPYNIKNKQGKTALMVSAKNGHKNIVNELLKKKMHTEN